MYHYGRSRPVNRGYKRYKHDSTRPTMNKELDIDTGLRTRIVWKYAHDHAFMWGHVNELEIWPE